MSRTRTFHTSNEAAYVSLCKMISGAATDCANKLKHVTVPSYTGRDSYVFVPIDTTEICGGVVRPLKLDPVKVSGWRLLTAPFFLSYPSIRASGGSVYIQRFNKTGDLVDKDFYGECLSAFPAEMVMPPEVLSRVHTELLAILRYR